MKAQKDVKTGKWLIQYRYTDWQGIRRKSTKRGFDTKREAEEWLRNFLQSQQADFNMKFEEFIKLYYEDMKPRIRDNTMNTKKYIIDLKDYLKKNKRHIFDSMLISGKLHSYLANIDEQACDMFNTIIEQMKEAEDVTEQLKEDNQLEWVHRIDNIQAQVREIICEELIYV